MNTSMPFGEDWPERFIRVESMLYAHEPDRARKAADEYVLCGQPVTAAVPVCRPRVRVPTMPLGLVS